MTIDFFKMSKNLKKAYANGAIVRIKLENLV